MRIISLEGIAGAGKSTMAQYCKTYLESLNQKVLIHKPIRRASLSNITSLFGLAEINVWTMKLPNIDYRSEIFLFWAILIHENSKIDYSKFDYIIIDRYIDTISGLCFSKANSFNTELDIEEYYSFIKSSLYPTIPIPYLTFLFNIPYEEASARTNLRESREYTPEDIKMFDGIFNFNKWVSKKEPNRFITIDSSKPTDKVFQQIKPHLLGNDNELI